MTDNEAPIPSLAEFEAWSPEQVSAYTQGKSVLFAPGGTSRWYFLEHASAMQGYARREQFEDYARKSMKRILDISAMMCRDGISTVFVVGLVPDMNARDPDYNQNLRWVYNLFVDPASRASYDQHDLGILFRGGWAEAFERLGARDLMRECEALERETCHRPAWLIWLTAEDFIPQALAPLVRDHLAKTGQFPDRAELAAAYYGRPLDHVDIFVGNNKPSVKGLTAPLLPLEDLYFTVSPSFYMGAKGWRGLLYDHLFARRGHFRDYRAYTPEIIGEMREFYAANEDVTMGVGAHHGDSQTWRPLLSK